MQKTQTYMPRKLNKITRIASVVKPLFNKVIGCSPEALSKEVSSRGIFKQTNLAN